MSNINQIDNSATAILTSLPSNTVTAVKESKSEKYVKEKEDVIYESSSKNHMPDIDKIKSMKAENDQRIVNLLLKTTSKSFIKQLGGLRGVLDKLIKGEEVEGINLSITAEDIEKAKEDIAPNGYWSPEKTSDRLLEFAKALSGNNPSKADELIDAVKKGFKEASKIWGGKLPDISQKTYDLTMKKFDDWAKTKETL